MFHNVKNCIIFFKLLLEIKDGGSPPLTDYASLYVFVEKNLFPPVFENNNQNLVETIDESLPSGTTVLTVKAEDSDVYVSIPS
jgi:hypothetical protein